MYSIEYEKKKGETTMGLRIHAVTQYKVEYGDAYSTELTEDIIDFFRRNGYVSEDETEGEVERSVFLKSLNKLPKGELKTALKEIEKDTRTDDEDDIIHTCVRYALF